ncbi:MAG: carbamoyltransferase C-terminal domain-containing protein [Nitrososphaera sp.]
MNLLGLTLGQTSGSAVFSGNKIVFSSSEERYSRRKSDEAYPYSSINDALKNCGISPKDLDKVVIAGKGITLMPVLLRTFSSFSVADHLAAMEKYWYPKLVKNRDVNILKLFANKVHIDQFPFNEPKITQIDFKKIKYPITAEDEKKISRFYKRAISAHLGIAESKIVHLDHHSCHAAYAFYGSPIRDDRTMVLTADAWGDDLSGSISVFDKEKNAIKRVKAYHHKDFQLARIYRYTTLFLRMLPNEHEYKVMGLAPYYQGSKVAEVEKVFDSMQTIDGLKFKFNPQIRDIYHYLAENLQQFRFDHIAAGLQSFTEKILTTWVKNAMRHHGCKSLVFSGGVSMNVKANMKIGQLEEVDRFFVCGGGADESLSMGACYLYAQQNGVSPSPLSDLYLGPECRYSEGDLDQVSKRYSVAPFTSTDQIVDRLLEGKIVATCLGRMEMGPRALCNRSILADPRQQQNIEKINRKIKNRDFWMPFAPVVLEEYQDMVIRNDKKFESPYMTIAFDSIDGKQKMPAAVHMYDGTARPLILKKETNPIIWETVKKFYDRTGVPALVNTSFNLHGEPLVNTFADAMHVFDNSGLDTLWLDRHVIDKQ